MRLQDVPRLLPGADVAISVRRGFFLVTLKHDGRIGTGRHCELTFAVTRAMLRLQ